MENAINWNRYESASEEEKLQMLKKGAEQGDALCQFGYGYYLKDEERTYHSAMLWFKEAAKQGLVVALHTLGILSSGCKAVGWLRNSVENGCAASWLALGIMYEYGHEDSISEAELGGGSELTQRHFHPDTLSAYWCFKNAVEKVYDEEGLKRTLGPLYSDELWSNLLLDRASCVATAQYELGMMHLNRYNITGDITACMGWLTKAAENGNEDAAYTLGNIYADGSYGVKSDTVKAKQLVDSCKSSPHRTSMKQLRHALKSCLK